MANILRPVAILGGSRIPFARANGAYVEANNQQMLTAALSALVDRFQLKGERLGEVAAGAVIKHSRDWNLARESTLGSGLHPETPAYDLQRACGTSLSAAAQVANRIAAGEIEVAIAGGADSASDIPLGYGRNLQQAVLRMSRSRTFGERLSSIGSVRLGDLKPTHPGIAEPRTGLSMGQHCEEMAKEWSVGRREQDELALASHKNAAAAWSAGFFDDLVAPFEDLKRDNNVRGDTSLEKLASLRTAFDPSPAGTLTAGNSSPLTDGAACVLLASEDWARSHGFEPQCFLTHVETAAVDFVGMAGPKEGMLMAPAYAVPRMLERARMRLQDFDIYEIHEAFAAQVLCTLKAWESEDYCRQRLNRGALGSIDRSKLNPKGSSVALGHPFAATGARIIATLAKQLALRGSGRGLISICAAGGMGVTAILER
ncbi:MAG TPA: acetyl-CoA C-acetyltransferase [Burkholderiales bacterium]|nr:acetyl-CoA C-acetyltransferase [Burkholderiales bacterium]